MALFDIFRRNRNPFDLEWIAREEEGVRFTPDIWRLERRPWWWLFVYGEEQWTIPLDGTLQGRAYTKEQFTLWKYRAAEASWAFALEAGTTGYPWASDLTIQGQLYRVPPEVIGALDMLYRNTVEFDRRSVRIMFPFLRTTWTNSMGILKEDFDVAEYKAFMYVGKPDHFKSLLSKTYDTPLNRRRKQEYDLVRSYKPRSSYLQPYYYFSFLEYEPIIPIETPLPTLSFE